MGKQSSSRFVLFIIGSGILFGSSGTSQAFAPENATSLSIGSARLGFGGLILAIIGLVFYLRKPPAVRSQAQGGWETWVAILIGGVSLWGYQASFFTGTRLNGVAFSTVVAIGSSPMFAGLFEWIVAGIKPDLKWLLLTGVGVSGVSLLSASGNAFAPTDPWGVLASLTAGATYAAYTVAMKKLLGRGWSSQVAVGGVLGCGAILSLIALATTDVSWIAEPSGLAVTAWLAIMTVVAAYTLNGAGLVGISAAKTATLTLAEPATAATLGILVLHEQLTTSGCLGIALVVASIILLGMPKRTKNAKLA